MKTATSRLTRKYQATIPQPVRAALHLGAGDAIAFDIDDDSIKLRKAQPIDLAWAKALEGTLSEWQGEADEEAYRGL
jgi:AbrB family looped-hinge helix DNA binding protein